MSYAIFPNLELLDGGSLFGVEIVDIEGNFTKGAPGNYFGLPENCYPDEDDDGEVHSVWLECTDGQLHPDGLPDHNLEGDMWPLLTEESKYLVLEAYMQDCAENSDGDDIDY